MADVTSVRVPHETVNDETVTLRRRVVAEGQPVESGRVLAEVETSKAIVEIEAPRAGYVFWSVAAGADVAVGAELCCIGNEPGRPAAVLAAAAGASAARSAGEPQAATRFSARALALVEQHGLDATLFAGRGLVRAVDVERLLDPSGTPAPPRTAAAAPRAPAAPPAPAEPARREKLSRAKRTENRLLLRAAVNAVPSSVCLTVPTSGVRAMILEHTDRYGSFTAVVVGEAARLLKKYAVLNGYQHDDHLYSYEAVNVAVAMDAGKGLKAPVIRAADTKSVREIAGELQTRLMEYLRDQIPAEALSGGTFTLSDLSGEGVQQFVPVLNEAQAATLGVGAELPAGEGGRRALTLTLTFDHLVTEGRTAAAFLRDLAQALHRYEDELAGSRPPAKAASAPAAAPGDPLVGYVIEAWAAALDLPAVGAQDNFFELGGDSIRAARLINRIQDLAGETFHAVAIFDAPTAVQFAAMLRSDYPRTTAEILKTLPAAGSTSAPAALPATDEPRVDEAQVARLRALIPTLPAATRAIPARKNPPAVFILSPPRCGSTLLRVMLAGHPRLFAPPELELLNFDSLGSRRELCTGPLAGKLEGLLRAVMELKGLDVAGARALLAPYEDRDLDVGRFFAELQGWAAGRLLVDKTPAYALDARALERAEAYFEAPLYVYLNRHPYGMVLSFEESRIDQVFFRVQHPFGVRRLAELIWNVCTEHIAAFLKPVPAERRFTLRYEDLVRAPRERMQALCGFLGVPFDERTLTPYEDTRSKMTDGLHEVSRMIGDPKFHRHRSIDPGMAERWREVYTEDFLGDVTWRNAEPLGYPPRSGG